MIATTIHCIFNSYLNVHIITAVMICVYFFHHILLLFVYLADTRGTNLSHSLLTTNLPEAANETGLTSKIFVPSPIFLLLVSVGIVGFVGNILVLCFLKSKRKTTSFMTSNFEKNFNVYVEILPISIADVLSDVISFPPICFQLYFHNINHGWGCRVVRYLNICFLLLPWITCYLLALRDIFQLVKFQVHLAILQWKDCGLAWLARFFVVLLPGITFKGVKFDLNDTHYTVECKYDNKYLPFGVIFLIYTTFQYILPGCIIIVIDISLIKTLWTRLKRRTADVQWDNAIKMMCRAATIRGTSIVITLTLAFVLPYCFYFALLIYNMIA